MEWLKLLKSLPVVVGLLTIYFGYSSWRRDFLGKRRIELAEKTLALFYEAKDMISAIRSPASFVGEGSVRKRAEGETEQESQILDNAYVALARYNKNLEFFAKIRAARYEFMARFGIDSATPFKDLDNIIHKILVSSHMLARHWLQQGRVQFRDDAQFEQHLKQMHEQEAIFWEGAGDPDPIKILVDSMITSIEGICLEVIQPPTSMLGRLKMHFCK